MHVFRHIKLSDITVLLISFDGEVYEEWLSVHLYALEVFGGDCVNPLKALEVLP